MRKPDQGFTYYPAFLRISGKKCVVVGGGRVALRKVRTLLGYGGRVEVISPDLCPELAALAEGGQINTKHRSYRPGDLHQAFMAIAAADNGDINRQVLREAREKSVLVNVADGLEDSDFIVPSSVRRGGLTIAVSTGGKSPALARKIRTRLEKEFGDEYIALVNLVGEARDEAKRRGIRVTGDDWQAALDLDLIIDLLRREGAEKARDFLLDRLKARQE
jgi:siroheme synthase-like protein